MSHQLYTTQLIVRATDEIEDFALGNIELEIQRKEDGQRADKGSLMQLQYPANLKIRTYRDQLPT